MTTQPLQPGDPRQTGPYRLLARLGSGGMGSVFLGRSAGGRTVAVKLVHAELARDPEFRRRFRNEVRAVREVGGEFTAPVLDADTEAEIPWLATAYIAGPTLQEVLDGGYGPLPERSLRPLAAGLAGALRAVHGRGLVHRDLKPSNVILTLDGPRVIDFGIARAVDFSVATRTGAVLGTPAFMSPEQVRGERVTPASDVFSLGSVLAYAATGRFPFATADSGMHAVMMRISSAEPDLDGLPGPLRELAESCLAKDASARPSPAEIIERVGAAVTGPWLPPEVMEHLSRHAVALLDLEAPGPDGPRTRPAERSPTFPAAPQPPQRPVSGPPPAALPPAAPPAPAFPAREPIPRALGLVIGALAALIVVAVVAVVLKTAGNGRPSASEARENGASGTPAATAPRATKTTRTATEPAAKGDVPPAFIGTWEGTITGPQTRRMTIKQGRYGNDVVITRTSGSRARCEGAGTLVSAGARTLVVDTRVTASEPPGACVSVGEQTLTLTGDDTIRFRAEDGTSTGTLRRLR
ncbi:serine/threonine-protein kinase [Actinomadura sp. SCN-SB]|uniref:serine/threonine-protein kinase n=1 Tax=Actinomadura sp. SCN-SB TaxID=3373092 RepID=UPI003752A4A3